MVIKLVSYDGVSINNGTDFTAIIPEDAPAMFRVDCGYVERGSNFPLLGYTQPRELLLPVQVVFRGAKTLDDVKRLFNPLKPGLRRLVMTDGERLWYCEARATTVQRSSIQDALVILAAPDAVWRSAARCSAHWTVTGNGQTYALPVGGTSFARPVVRITAQGAKSQVGGYDQGYQFKRFAPIYNRMNGVTLSNYPLDIACGLDTAALIAAGKMQANGDDLRVFVNGVEVSRFVYGVNTTATKVWINVNLGPRTLFTLASATPASGAVGELLLKPDARLSKLKAKGIVMIGSELFEYDGYDVKLAKLGNVRRAAKNSTAAAHAAGDGVRVIDNDVWLVYGNNAAGAPVVDESLRPMFELSSTNDRHVYAVFADGERARPGEFKAAILSTGVKQQTYCKASAGDVDGASESPQEAEVLGLACLNTLKSGKAAAGACNAEWRLYEPAGITQVTALGQKFRRGAGWPGVCGLQKSANGSAWSQVWNETAPVNTSEGAPAWTAVNRPDVSLGGSFAYLRLAMVGGLKAGAESDRACLEVGELTATLNGSNVPGTSLGAAGGETPAAEQGNYSLNATLTNEATGEAMRLQVNMRTGECLTVDSERKTVTLGGQNALSALHLSTVRGDWLALLPGENTIRYNDEGTTGVEVEFEWEERLL